VRALLDAVLVDLDGTLAAPAVTETRPDPRANGHTNGNGNGHGLPLHLVEDLASLATQVWVGMLTSDADHEAATSTLLDAAAGGTATIGPAGLVGIVGPGSSAPGGLDPDTLRAALDELGLRDPGRVLLAGDPRSEEAATAAGLPFLDVTASDDGVGRSVQSWVERVAGHRFELARAAITQSDADAAQAATARVATQVRSGGLGRLESLGVQLAAIAGTVPPPVPLPARVAVFAADHGVTDWNVSPQPAGATTAMATAVLDGTATVDVLARHLDSTIEVVDVGLSHPIAHREGQALLRRPVRAGTDNMGTGPAMSRVDALLCLDIGVEVAQRCVAAGARCLVTGDLGVGNTTAATAVIAAVTARDPDEITGRGAGADDEMLARKRAVIDAALERVTSAAGPLTVLEQVGGLEIAALCGFIVGGAALRVPVLVDGLVADAALLLAVRLAPDVIDYVVCSQRSAEPAAAAALEHLDQNPLLALELRIGEGIGGVLALPLLVAAAELLTDLPVAEATPAVPEPAIEPVGEEILVTETPAAKKADKHAGKAGRKSKGAKGRRPDDAEVTG
jgi:nicotinate-nucleotide--dimethylbenzimidazole phosphoribosyltransferase